MFDQLYLTLLVTSDYSLIIIIIIIEIYAGAQIVPSPSEPVCPGNRVIFTCQQTGATQWEINLQPTLLQSAQSTQVGSVITFGVDRGFNFELHIVSFSSGILTTELQVTAVRELNEVTVVCIGASDDFMSTIQIASVGELIAALDYNILTSIRTLQLFQVESWQPISSSQKLEPQ